MYMGFRATLNFRKIKTEARVLLANRVRYHDDTYVLTCER